MPLSCYMNLKRSSLLEQLYHGKSERNHCKAIVNYLNILRDQLFHKTCNVSRKLNVAHINLGGYS